MENEIVVLKDEISRLKLAVGELAILNEIAIAISSTVDLEKLVDLIVQKCVKHLKVEQGAVMLINVEDHDAALRTMVRKVDSAVNALPYRLDTQLTGWMLKNKNPLLVNDFRNDERFQISKDEDLSINSMLAVPLQLKGKMIGILSVFNKRQNEVFCSDDQRLLTIIAAQSAQVIESARLYLEEQEFLLMQQEMDVAKKIQINLLPREAPQIPGYDISGSSIPAKEVGGDYYDFINKDDRLTAFCLADISGKGISAAMLMSNLQATLRSQTVYSSSPKECIKTSNNLLYKSTDSEKYATLFYGILDNNTPEIHFCNAGHNQPILIRSDGNLERLEAGGIVLGFLEDFEFIDSSVKINSGDILVIFSDGITEAMNAEEEEFDEKRLIEVIYKNKNENAESIIKNIEHAVNDFAGETPQSDDMTTIVIKRI